jgi:hypothetical protein
LLEGDGRVFFGRGGGSGQRSRFFSHIYSRIRYKLGTMAPKGVWQLLARGDCPLTRYSPGRRSSTTHSTVTLSVVDGSAVGRLR